MKTYGSTEEENISEDGSNEQNCHDEVPKKKKTIHDEIMSIAVPALAGLAIDPLMVSIHKQYDLFMNGSLGSYITLMVCLCLFLCFFPKLSRLLLILCSLGETVQMQMH